MQTCVRLDGPWEVEPGPCTMSPVVARVALRMPGRPLVLLRQVLASRLGQQQQPVATRRTRQQRPAANGCGLTFSRCRVEEQHRGRTGLSHKYRSRRT